MVLKHDKRSTVCMPLLNIFSDRYVQLMHFVIDTSGMIVIQHDNIELKGSPLGHTY